MADDAACDAGAGKLFPEAAYFLRSGRKEGQLLEIPLRDQNEDGGDMRKQTREDSDT